MPCGTYRTAPIPDSSFYDALPTVWDDTKVLDGYPGELDVIARKNGNNWFLGAIIGVKEHALSVLKKVGLKTGYVLRPLEGGPERSFQPAPD
ncbi:MAG: glycoside hydrolase family 97 C-terminal domain-containing protein [Bacteroidetes bacterium]|nr:glycoside hydrolase family 97 C-terminal domain-containing protein [Bacteroidota bacterium]MDA1122379.1 glycoside hydrolase family 97 C-terminal domain-containing protein [Bacteroidota bacterium]